VIRQHLVEEGFEAVLSRKQRATREKEAKLIALARSSAPRGRVRWTLNLLLTPRAGNLWEFDHPI
jgi:hypothetical protein